MGKTAETGRGPGKKGETGKGNRRLRNCTGQPTTTPNSGNDGEFPEKPVIGEVKKDLMGEGDSYIFVEIPNTNSDLVLCQAKKA